MIANLPEERHAAGPANQAAIASPAASSPAPVQSANGDVLPGVGEVAPPGNGSGWGQYVHDLWKQIFNGSASAAPAPSASDQGVDGSGVRGQETFTDAWASNPTQGAPVRTWVDPTARTGADGQFVSAWHDTPAQASMANAVPIAPTPVAPVGAPPATPLTGLISTLQQTTPDPVVPTYEGSWHNPDMDSSGGSGGSGGSGE